jgi:hypothetical protein
MQKSKRAARKSEREKRNMGEILRGKQSNMNAVCCEALRWLDVLVAEGPKRAVFNTESSS